MLPCVIVRLFIVGEVGQDDDGGRVGVMEMRVERCCEGVRESGRVLWVVR